LKVEAAGDYSENGSKQLRSRVLQMDAPPSVSMHSTNSFTQRFSQPQSTLSDIKLERNDNLLVILPASYYFITQGNNNITR
jgi:hypothetical protein